MAKKMKRKTLVGLLVVSSVIATAGVLGVIDGTTGGSITKMFEEENISSGKLNLTNFEDYFVEDLTDENTLSQKAEIEYEGKLPFDKITANLNLYDNGDEGAGIEVTDVGTVLFKNVSKLQIKLSLVKDIDFYVSSFTIPELDFYDDKGTIIKDKDEKLSYTLKVGRHNFDYYDGPTSGVCVANNAYSGNVVITITNPYAKQGKDSYFSLGDAMCFNYLDSSSWSYPA